MLDLTSRRETQAAAAHAAAGGYQPRPRPLTPRLHAEEAEAHHAFLLATLKDRSLWAGYGLEVVEPAA